MAIGPSGPLTIWQPDSSGICPHPDVPNRDARRSHQSGAHPPLTKHNQIPIKGVRAAVGVRHVVWKVAHALAACPTDSGRPRWPARPCVASTALRTISRLVFGPSSPASDAGLRELFSFVTVPRVVAMSHLWTHRVDGPKGSAWVDAPEGFQGVSEGFGNELS
jgi:hypothetical protein